MNTPSAKLLILAGKHFACIKVIGRATFSCSVDFRTVITELHTKGYRWFVIELSECALMDSTFLGVLAGFGLNMRKNADKEPVIELWNPNVRIRELLENLGVLHLFQVCEGQSPGDPQATEHTPIQCTREEVTLACLEAHETLMAINPANVSKFKDVTKFMAEDLKRLKMESRSAPPPPPSSTD
jgi:anti-anti-sigma regulatory factor